MGETLNELLKYVKVRKCDPHGTVMTTIDNKRVVIEKRNKLNENNLRSANEQELLGFIAFNEATLFNDEEVRHYNRFIKKSENELFTDDDADINKKSRNIGPGELSIRMHEGLSTDIKSIPGGTNGVDLPEIDVEIKSGQLKPGEHARTAWVTLLTLMYNDDKNGMLVDGHKDWLQNEFKNGQTWMEVIWHTMSVTTLELLPENVSKRIISAMRPSTTLDYATIFHTWPKGYIRIPKHEYDVAYKFMCASQKMPRYNLSRDYLEKRAIEHVKREQMLNKSTKRVGVIVASCKPFHEGHRRLIDIAARENDTVMLFVSLTDRKRSNEFTIHGQTMRKLWDEQFLKLLPSNVIVNFTTSPMTPVRAAYEFLGKENQSCSSDAYRIYGLPIDLNAYFPAKSLEKYANDLFVRKLVNVEPVYSSDTMNVSGTMMRHWLQTDNKDAFFERVPEGADPELVWDAFKNC